MGLPARQQRVLERIDEGLCRSEPRLAAKFAMFARLCGSEVPPRRERLASEPATRSWAGALFARPAVDRTSRGTSALRRAIIVGNLAIALVLLAVLVALNSHTSGRCTAGARGGSKAAIAQVRGCPFQVGTQGNLPPK